MKHIAIIGGGPAALMLAAEIDTQKYRVTLFERNKALGRKFLVAGDGGLNLTYQSSVAELISHYSPADFMDPIIRSFTNANLMDWFKQRGVSTFVGSSNRVFPDKGWKPIQVLNKILEHLSAREIEFQMNTKWTGWNTEGHLCFENREALQPDITVFALGGASWKVTGSDGNWEKAFSARGVQVRPFRSANCAFSVDWQQDFIAAHEGKPLKNIALTFQDSSVKGELVISKFGLEGNAIYALSQKIQETLLEEDRVVIYLDLKPTLTVDQIRDKYHRSRRSKVTDILKRDLNLDRTSIGLLKQSTDKATFLNPDRLAKTIKSIPLVVYSADDLDRAISSLGGIALDEIDAHFHLKKIPHSYAIGEMLDWFAPTGGYLLQACFSMGFALAKHLNALEANSK
jgi:uncharacterized flavoprotein (TIGR03862 family)